MRYKSGYRGRCSRNSSARDFHPLYRGDGESSPRLFSPCIQGMEPGFISPANVVRRCACRYLTGSIASTGILHRGVCHCVTRHSGQAARCASGRMRCARKGSPRLQIARGSIGSGFAGQAEDEPGRTIESGVEANIATVFTGQAPCSWQAKTAAAAGQATGIEGIE